MSLIEFTIKQGDTRPIIQATVTTPVVLTNATVRFLMRLRADKSSKVAAAAVVTGALTMEYRWDAADTNTAGIYEAEFEVTFPSGLIETYPNGEYIRVTILEESG